MPLERRGKTGKAGQHVGSRKKGRATKCRSSMPASKPASSRREFAGAIGRKMSERTRENTVVAIMQ
jgi:hypothetical protein